MISKSKAIRLAEWELRQREYYPPSLDLTDVVESEGLWEPWASKPSGMIRQMVHDGVLLLSRYDTNTELRDILGPKLYAKAEKLCENVETAPKFGQRYRNNYGYATQKRADNGKDEDEIL